MTGVVMESSSRSEPLPPTAGMPLPPRARETWGAALAYLALPTLLLREALAAGWVAGRDLGETWGRLFAAGQVARWFQGACTPGLADLLNHPSGQPFWPVDPVTTGLMALVAAAAPDPARALPVAFGVAMGALWLLAGWCPWRLARTLGASPLAALAAGLLVQAHPYLLQNADDGVLEVLAVGPAAMTVEAVIRCWRAPGPRTALRVLLATLLLAGTGPYFAVYLVIGLVPAVPVATLLQRRDRPLHRLLFLVPLAVAGGLSLAPMLATEGGPHGRLGPAWSHAGYHEAPGERGVLDPSGALLPVPPPPPPTELGRGAPPPTWHRFLLRLPGGAAVCLAGLLGLLRRRSAPWAVLGLLLFGLGPGPVLVERAYHLGDPGTGAPVLLQELLRPLPVAGALGNPQRLIVAWALLAAMAGALACGRSRWVPALLAAAAVGNLAVARPDLRVTRTPLPPDPRSLDLRGPLVVFPNGDPPVWNQGAAPKEALYLAALAGQPVAGDFGRRRRPADLPLVLALSRAAGLPVDRAAAGGRAVPPLEQALAEARTAGFRHIVVLTDRLDEVPEAKLHTALDATAGLPPVQADGWMAWDLAPAAAP